MKALFLAGILFSMVSCNTLLAQPSASDSAAKAQQLSDLKKILHVMADSVVRQAAFQFVDQKSGRRFTSPEESPPGSQLKLDCPYTDWRYWNGVLNIAMINLGEALGEPAYIKFSQKNIVFNFDNYSYFENKYKDEDKWSYPFAQHFIMEELDDYGAMGASLIEVQQRDPQDRYLMYIDRAAKYLLDSQHRLEDGPLVRSFPEKWTLWADDLYMSVSFLSRMGAFSGDHRYLDDAVMQVINFHKHLFNGQKGLMCHYWYSNVNRPCVAFWGRANGWTMMAQVDLLDRLPKNHPQRDTLLALLRRQIAGIARYQSSNGLWHQLLDKPDSYLETSCTAMFTYAIARAVNKGYIDSHYAAVAQRGWEGIASKIHSDGTIEGVCAGTSVSDDLAYYYGRPTPPNDMHGIGAVLLAGAEVLRLSK